MNKFDNEYNKILNKQNLIQQELIKQISFKDIKAGASKMWNSTGGKVVDTVKSRWNSITEVFSDIGDAISKGLTWSINKIKQALQKLWDAITPDNAEQTVNSTKKLINIMPDFIAGQAKNAIKISQSEQFKIYIQTQIKKQFKTPNQFNQLSTTDKKKFIQNKTNIYIKQNNIISQNIINEQPVTIGLIVTIIKILAWVGGITWITNLITKAGKDIGWIQKTPADKAKQNADAAKHKLDQTRTQQQMTIERAKMEQWKNDQQRQKIFQQIINVSVFQ